MECLENTGVIVHLGRFKEKEVFCTRCKSMFLKHEEKETDVSIAITLFEVLLSNACETVVIVSSDTDLSPAVLKSRELFPDRQILFAFPYARRNNELLKIAPRSFSISKKQYIRYQFPNPVVLKSGRLVTKPDSW